MADIRKIEKLKKLRRFLLWHLGAFWVLVLVGWGLFKVWMPDTGYDLVIKGLSAFQASALTISLLGFRSFNLSPGSQIAILMLTEAGILWQLYFQFRVIHLLSLKEKSKAYSWRSTVLFCLAMQVTGMLVLMAFWKPSITEQANIPYLWNALFHGVMLHAGSFWHLWGGYDNEILRDQYLIKLAVTGISLLFMLGFWIIIDIGNVKRLQSRLMFPKKNWTLPTRFALTGLMCLLIMNVIPVAFTSSELPRPLVTRSIEVLFRTAGIVGNFNTNVGPNVAGALITKIISVPFGSPMGNGLLALAMLFMLPMVKRYFPGKTYLRALLLFVGLLSILSLLILILKSGYDLILPAALFIWIAKLPLILLALIHWRIRKLSKAIPVAEAQVL